MIPQIRRDLVSAVTLWLRAQKKNGPGVHLDRSSELYVQQIFALDFDNKVQVNGKGKQTHYDEPGCTFRVAAESHRVNRRNSSPFRPLFVTLQRTKKEPAGQHPSPWVRPTGSRARTR